MYIYLKLTNTTHAQYLLYTHVHFQWALIFFKVKIIKTRIFRRRGLGYLPPTILNEQIVLTGAARFTGSSCISDIRNAQLAQLDGAHNPEEGLKKAEMSTKVCSTHCQYNIV